MELSGDIGKGASPFVPSTRTDSHAQYSPDGTKIVFESSRSGNSELWICDADGSDIVRLTSLGAPVSGLPRWSPDGKQIVFHSRPKGQADIFVIDAAGGASRQITNDSEEDTAPSWSRDGQWIYFESKRSGQMEVWKIALDVGSPIQVTSNGVRDTARIYRRRVPILLEDLYKAPDGGESLEDAYRWRKGDSGNRVARERDNLRAYRGSNLLYRP